MAGNECGWCGAKILESEKHREFTNARDNDKERFHIDCSKEMENLGIIGYNQKPKKVCLCWLSECFCQFQRHKGPFTICESQEIFRKCLNKEDINDGGQ